MQASGSDRFESLQAQLICREACANASAHAGEAGLIACLAFKIGGPAAGVFEIAIGARYMWRAEAVRTRRDSRPSAIVMFSVHFSAYATSTFFARGVTILIRHVSHLRLQNRISRRHVELKYLAKFSSELGPAWG